MQEPSELDFSIPDYDYDNLRLTIEFVPSTSWYNNLRKVLPPWEWNRIRIRAIKDSHERRAICGAATEKLECHERWEYDEETKVQTLNGFLALCRPCHLVKHIGLTGILASKGKIDIKNIEQHFVDVNECTMELYRQYHKYAFQQWSRRSSEKWKADFGEYKQLIPNAPHSEDWII